MTANHDLSLRKALAYTDCSRNTYYYNKKKRTQKCKASTTTTTTTTASLPDPDGTGKED